MKKNMPYEKYKQEKCRTCKLNKKCTKDENAVIICAVTNCYDPMYKGKSEYWILREKHER